MKSLYSLVVWTSTGSSSLLQSVDRGMFLVLVAKSKSCNYGTSEFQELFFELKGLTNFTNFQKLLFVHGKFDFRTNIRHSWKGRTCRLVTKALQLVETWIGLILESLQKMEKTGFFRFVFESLVFYSALKLIITSILFRLYWKNYSIRNFGFVKSSILAVTSCWSSASCMREILDRGLVVPAIREQVAKESAKVDVGHLVQGHFPSYIQLSWLKAILLVPWEDAIQLLTTPFLGDAVSQAVLVVSKASIQVTLDVRDMVPGAQLANATEKRRLMVVDIVHGHLDRLDLSAKLIDVHVVLKVPIIELALTNDFAEEETLKFPLLRSVAAITQRISREIHNDAVEDASTDVHVDVALLHLALRTCHDEFGEIYWRKAPFLSWKSVFPYFSKFRSTFQFAPKFVFLFWSRVT